MKRKKGLGLVAIILTILLTACEEDSVSGEELESHNLVVSHFQPGNHPIQTEVLENFEKNLNDRTDAQITMDFYPSNSLGDAGSHYDMAVTGEADIGLSVYGYSTGRFPLVTVMELPFLAESAAQSAEILTTLHDEFSEMQEEHGDTHPLFLFSAEPAQIISKSHKIESPEDLEGLRVRSPSAMANDIISELGATPISMPMGDVYESLERGVIDAAMVPLEALLNYSFHEVANYVTIGNFSATPFFSVMNKKTYNNFSDHDEKVLDNLADKEMARKAGSIYDKDGQKGLEIAKENGAEVVELNEEQLKEWDKALEPMVEQWIQETSDQGYPAQKIYDRAMELNDETNVKERE